jgi:pimeloyl-ACP methyl ester carboxylesterase
MARPRVILLPGVVLPAKLAFALLVQELGAGVDAVPKDLELYTSGEPPEDYSVDHEVAGVLREADRRGWERFHIAGYSGGGTAALALAARDPERLLSLALLEPATAGTWDLAPAERAVWREYERLERLPPDQKRLPPDQSIPGFMQLQVKPGVTLPPPPTDDPPPWMATRPAGIRAFLRTFRTYELDRGALERFARPVYFALGGLSNPDQFGEIARRLAGVFPDFELEVFEDRHHFDPPHRIEPARLAGSLRALWRRGEALTTPATARR